MSKIIIAIITIILIAGLGYWIYQSTLEESSTTIPEEGLVVDPLNATYIIEGDEFTLVDGKAEKEIVSGAASKIRINVFDGWSTKGDVNDDDLEDTVVLLTYNAGGSGTFFYVVLAIQKKQGYEGTNAIFIGDRIAPQTTEIRSGEIIVNYADRYPWESFTDQTSVVKSKYLIYESDELKEKQMETLSQETAENLVIENWGGCETNECSDLTVSILDGKDDVWYVQAIYDGMKDDSVKAQKRIATVHYVNGEWKWGSEIVKEYKCQEGRGQQNFSSEFCL